MVVQPLRGQHLGQVALLAAALLQLGPLVLEPDLDLGLVQPEVVGQVTSPLLSQVAVLLKLSAQAAQLVGGEGCARPLLVRIGGCSSRGSGRTVSLFDLSGSRTCEAEKKKLIQ